MICTSYIVMCLKQRKRETAATSDYGTEFGAVVNKDKIFGVQFHPEKSQKLGRKFSKTLLNIEMLKKRIIPKLQMSLRQSYRGPKPVLVVTRNFESKRAIGDPLQAKIYEAQLADELIFVDLERTEESWSVMLSTWVQ